MNNPKTRAKHGKYYLNVATKPSKNNQFVGCRRAPHAPSLDKRVAYT